jgi:hypothetical protein
MCRGGPRRLCGYGDLGLRTRARARGLRVAGTGATDEAFAVRALAPDAAGSLAPGERVNALPGKAAALRLWTRNSRWSNGGRTANLARSRELLGSVFSGSAIQVPSPGTELADVERDAAALKPTFICRHCGTAMIIVQTFARGEPIRAPPQQACAP